MLKQLYVKATICISALSFTHSTMSYLRDYSSLGT